MDGKIKQNMIKDAGNFYYKNLTPNRVISIYRPLRDCDNILEFCFYKYTASNEAESFHLTI